MFHAYKVFLATAYPSGELVETMKRLLACLVLCASLSASAQDDNCTVLGVQELSLAYHDLNASIDSITNSIAAVADSLSALNVSPVIVEYDFCFGEVIYNSLGSLNIVKSCVNTKIDQGWVPFGSAGMSGNQVWQAMVKYADN